MAISEEGMMELSGVSYKDTNPIDERSTLTT